MTSVLGVVPARGGSKGLPRKNILKLGDIPLIAHTIRAAADSKMLSKTIISTDDEEIAKVSRHFGGQVPFIRDPELASDTSSSTSVAIDALEYLTRVKGESYDILVLLQPTSPFRSGHTIDSTVKILLDYPEANCAITVAPVGSCNPNYFYKQRPQSPFWEPIMGSASVGVRRQDFETLYVRTGAVYAVRTSYLLAERSIMAEDCLAFITDVDESINIDSKLDLFIANSILHYRRELNEIKQS